MANTISKFWLHLAIASLAIAGLYALPPVILRGPFFENLFDIHHVFNTALIIHVDFSILIWFLSLAALLWTRNSPKQSNAAFILSCIGTLAMLVTSFLPDSNPIKNNYVPMLNHPLFIGGLISFSAGITWQLILTLLTLTKNPAHLIKDYYTHTKPDLKTHLEQASHSTAIITLIAIICFIITYFLMPTDFTPKDGLPYYELLFWGGGHALQFTFVQLMIIAWIWSCHIIQLPIPLSPRTISLLLLSNIIFVLPLPFSYLFYTLGEGELRLFFTHHMRVFGGLSAIIIGLAITYSLCKHKTDNSPTKLLLIFSLLLFATGGIIGLMITTVNAQVPAHYHGSIIAITCALMAIIYHILPEYGYNKIKGKLATLQPICYGGGQLMHILGLALMGGYGALRKAPGSTASIDTTLGKTLFFLGGSLAILGGLLFIVLTYRAILQRPKK